MITIPDPARRTTTVETVIDACLQEIGADTATFTPEIRAEWARKIRAAAFSEAADIVSPDPDWTRTETDALVVEGLVRTRLATALRAASGLEAA